jgi:hypothetical protein
LATIALAHNKHPPAELVIFPSFLSIRVHWETAEGFSRSQGPALPILQKPKYFQHSIKKRGNVLTFAESLAIV